MLMSKMCPRCAISKTDGRNFCDCCGSKLEPLPHCRCGNDLYPSDKYCDTCGLSRGVALSRDKSNDKTIDPKPP